MARKPKPDPARRILNKKARHNYFIHETIEAGLALTGPEVKSLRAGAVDISDAFVRINGHQAKLCNCQIDRYPHAVDQPHDPLRKRPLLLHRREIAWLTSKLAQKGMTLIPLAIYFNARGLAKIELGLATGKRAYDKRQELRKKDHDREMRQAMSRRR